MSRYIEFPTSDGGVLLVEVEREEVDAPAGAMKAGLLDRRAGDAVVAAESKFDAAIGTAVRQSVLALRDAVLGLPDAPGEVELTFSLKATGEVGNVAIAKVGGEANFTVRLLWKSVRSDTE